jgi:hypothetical protein
MSPQLCLDRLCSILSRLRAAARAAAAEAAAASTSGVPATAAAAAAVRLCRRFRRAWRAASPAAASLRRTGPLTDRSPASAGSGGSFHQVRTPAAARARISAWLALSAAEDGQSPRERAATARTPHTGAGGRIDAPERRPGRRSLAPEGRGGGRDRRMGRPHTREDGDGDGARARTGRAAAAEAAATPSSGGGGRGRTCSSGRRRA